jgi:uncharacterized LabA/DUF88 family protein
MLDCRQRFPPGRKSATGKQVRSLAALNGFMVVTKDGAPAEEGHYKANVDVMMAIDALELSSRCVPML